MKVVRTYYPFYAMKELAMMNTIFEKANYTWQHPGTKLY